MLYVALEQDLRDRYPGSTWLVYGKQIHETKFTVDDVVILTEWSMEDHSALLDGLYHIRHLGARVIYIGAEDSDTDEWKRQLVFLGVWDFLFVRDELNLREVDKLIDHPKTAKDVEPWLATRHTTLAHPQVVDVFDGTEDVPELADARLIQEAEDPARALNTDINNGSHRALGLKRMTQWFHRREQWASLPRTATATQPRIVWPSPKPLHIAIVGSPGVGKSFVAWNLSALCSLRDLATCIVERTLEPICAWADAEQTHVTTSVPTHGYRVYLVTHDYDSPIEQSDIVLVVTFPDPHRIHEALLWIEERGLTQRAMLVINHHASELGTLIDIPLASVTVPHDVRQMGAIRMRKPLAASDTRFARNFNPLVNRIGDMFLDRTERGNGCVAPTGV